MMQSSNSCSLGSFIDGSPGLQALLLELRFTDRVGAQLPKQSLVHFMLRIAIHYHSGPRTAVRSASSPRRYFDSKLLSVVHAEILQLQRILVYD